MSSRFPELLASSGWTPRPERPRTRGPAGRWDMGSGSIRSAAAAAPRAYPTWRARLRRGEKRRGAGGAGFQLSLTSSLSRQLCALRPLARPAAFNRGPPRPWPRPAPSPSSVPPHSGSPAPNPASASLQTPAPLLALRLRLLFFAGLSSRSCPPRGAESSGAPAMRRSRCLPICPLYPAVRLHPTEQRARDKGHGAGKVTEPQEVRTMLWRSIFESGGASRRVQRCHWEIGKGACGR